MPPHASMGGDHAYDIVRRLVGSSTQLVPSIMRPGSRPNYLKKTINVISVTPAAWHDFCTQGGISARAAAASPNGSPQQATGAIGNIYAARRSVK